MAELIVFLLFVKKTSISLDMYTYIRMYHLINIKLERTLHMFKYVSSSKTKATCLYFIENVLPNREILLAVTVNLR